jgi:hypothetical protein
MQAISAVYDPHSKYTPSEKLAALAHQTRRARIAANGRPDVPRAPVGFSIPNTPYGVPKIQPLQPVVKRERPPVYRMWFEDLTAEAERLMRPSRPLRIEDIQYVCASQYGCTRLDIISPCRKKEIVKPRQVAMYLAKKLTLRSLPEIGRRFGNRDHTTGLHAIRKMERLIARDMILAAEIADIEAAIAVRIA